MSAVREIQPIRLHPIPEPGLPADEQRIGRELVLHSSYLYDRSPRSAGSAAERRTAVQDMRSLLFADSMALEQLTGVSSLAELDEIRSNSKLRDTATQRATDLIAKRYGLDPAAPNAAITEIAHTADRTLDRAVKDFPTEFTAHGRDSKVRQIDHPLDLVLLATDPDAGRFDRFRALRKLHLMRTLATIDDHKRTEDIPGKLEKFRGFLEDHVLDPITPDDQIERFIISTHNTAEGGDFATITTAIVTRDEVDAMLPLRYGQKLTRVQKRTFTTGTPDGGLEVKNVYFPVVQQNPYLREKSDESIALKMNRKNQTLPAAAVDDQVGMMAVFDSGDDIRIFVRHISRQSAETYGSLMQFEETEDTLNGGKHNTVSAGSVSDIEWLKGHFGMDGIRPEFIGWKKDGLTNYLYKERQSHREYSNTRSFRDGVIRRLAPPWMYGYDSDEVEGNVIYEVRRQVQDPQRVNGNGEIIEKAVA
jgi:hypothetical protein